MADTNASSTFRGKVALVTGAGSEEIADVVLWLRSDGARFVTGQNILVDGAYAIAGHRPPGAHAAPSTPGAASDR
ncbi:SDR family oxidoreductase [Sorangium sp. So ce1024]|uniref:SDR family oxidoreductase n=1 Tax=unclassified Sorangium TaxID=2621164 RepID=UPI003F031F84